MYLENLPSILKYIYFKVFLQNYNIITFKIPVTIVRHNGFTKLKFLYKVLTITSLESKYMFLEAISYSYVYFNW